MKIEITKKQSKSAAGERLKKFQDKVLKRFRKGEKQDEHS